MIKRRTLLVAPAALLPGAFAANAVHAQPSNKATKMFVGFAPGGGTDALARALTEAIRPAFPGGIFVESKLGASGRLAVQATRAAEPDGSALLFTPDFALTVYPHSFKKLGYDPIKDLTPVAACAKSGYAFCAGPGVPSSVKNMRDYVQWVKANPQSGSYGSSGAGTTLHFAGLMLEKATGLSLTHVPYKGGALSMTDVMGGQIPVSINAVGEALPHYQAGKIRVLGTFGTSRSPFMPDVPTMVESGYKDVVSEAWLAVLMPPKTPPALVSRIADVLNKATGSSELRERFAKFGMEPVTSSPSELADLIAADTRRWEPIVKASGFTADE